MSTSMVPAKAVKTSAIASPMYPISSAPDEIPIPRNAPPDFRMLDRATWPQTIAPTASAKAMGKDRNNAHERIARIRLTIAIGAVRDRAGTDVGGSFSSAIAPLYRTEKQMQAAVRA